MPRKLFSLSRSKGVNSIGWVKQKVSEYEAPRSFVNLITRPTRKEGTLLMFFYIM